MLCLFQCEIDFGSASDSCPHPSLPQLANTEEFIDGQFTGNLGEVLIR